MNNKTAMKSIFALAFLASQCIFSQQQKQYDSVSTVTVRINGLKVHNGQVLLSLFNSSNGFPTEPEKALRWGKSNVTSSSVIISINGIAFGEYAIAVLHDLNNNNVMDRDWLGLPEESYGISNNPENHISVPKYEEAKFKFSNTRDTIEIQMRP